MSGNKYSFLKFAQTYGTLVNRNSSLFINKRVFEHHEAENLAQRITSTVNSQNKIKRRS